jgi:lactoylglutathione lyase
MQLGAFSVSLAVQDLAASRAFYEALGFEVVGGEAEQNWLILRNGDHTLGLFQGMFERNLLTFNPGWDCRSARPLESFTDVREIQKRVKAAGVDARAGDATKRAGARPASWSSTRTATRC